MNSGLPSRRWLVAVGAACFAGMSTAALAQEYRRARAAGRPLFTADALNRLIPASGARNHRAFLLGAARDVRAFVRSNFTLTAQQEAELAGISDSELASLQAMLRSAARNGDGIRVEIGAVSTARGTGEVLERAEELQREGADDEGQRKVGNIWRVSGGRSVEQTTLHIRAATLRPDVPAFERGQPD